MTDGLNNVGRSPKIARGVQDENIHDSGRRRQDIIDTGSGTEDEEDEWDRGLSEYMFDRVSRRSITAQAELITIVLSPETRK